jgi:hypothetical protein
MEIVMSFLLFAAGLMVRVCAAESYWPPLYRLPFVRTERGALSRWIRKR